MKSYDPNRALADAIILRAVRDYRKENDLEVIKEVERFILSPWFRVLTSIDPVWLIKKLRKEKISALKAGKSKCKRETKKILLAYLSS